LPTKKPIAEGVASSRIRTLPPPRRPTVRQSSAEVAAAYLRGLIFDGTLPPGSKIPQDEVAAALGMSRIPIREALAIIAAEGRVTIELHRGAFVRPMDESSVHEASDLVSMVTDYVIRRAVEHTTPELVGELELLGRALAAARRPEDVDQIVDEIRTTIFVHGTSPRVYAALRQVLAMTPYNFCVAFPDALPVQKAVMADLIAAIGRGEADVAAEVWADGHVGLRAIVLEGLKRRGVVAPS